MFSIVAPHWTWTFVELSAVVLLCDSIKKKTKKNTLVYFWHTEMFVCLGRADFDISVFTPIRAAFLSAEAAAGRGLQTPHSTSVCCLLTIHRPVTTCIHPCAEAAHRHTCTKSIIAHKSQWCQKIEIFYFPPRTFAWQTVQRATFKLKCFSASSTQTRPTR